MLKLEREKSARMPMWEHVFCHVAGVVCESQSTSLPSPAGWRQHWHQQRVCLGITCLSLQHLPRDLFSVCMVPCHLTGTVTAALWLLPFLNLSWLQGWLQISLGTQWGSAWLCLLRCFRDQPICLLTRQSCDAADNICHLHVMLNAK